MNSVMGRNSSELGKAYIQNWHSQLNICCHIRRCSYNITGLILHILGGLRFRIIKKFAWHKINYHCKLDTSLTVTS